MAILIIWLSPDCQSCDFLFAHSFTSLAEGLLEVGAQRADAILIPLPSASSIAGAYLLNGDWAEA